MTEFARFAKDDAGAITNDWTVITAGLLLMGTMVIYAIFGSDGFGGLVSNSNETLGGSGPTIVVHANTGYSGGGTDGGTDDGTSTCTGVC